MRDFALAPPTVSALTGGLADSIFDTAALNPTLPLLARRRAPPPPPGRRSPPWKCATRSWSWRRD